MAKKSRRARRSASTPVQPVRISRPASSAAPEHEVREIDFSKEYHYVVEDLKRIAIIAGVLLVLLVVMALVIG